MITKAPAVAEPLLPDVSMPRSQSTISPADERRLSSFAQSETLLRAIDRERDAIHPERTKLAESIADVDAKLQADLAASDAAYSKLDKAYQVALAVYQQAEQARSEALNARDLKVHHANFAKQRLERQLRDSCDPRIRELYMEVSQTCGRQPDGHSLSAQQWADIDARKSAQREALRELNDLELVPMTCAELKIVLDEIRHRVLN